MLHAHTQPCVPSLPSHPTCVSDSLGIFTCNTVSVDLSTAGRIR